MKIRIKSISENLVVVFFTLMVVIDFFPNIGINRSIGIGGVVTFLILAVITRQKGEPVFNSAKQELIFTLIFGIYIFLLIIILTLLGGVSQVGLGLTNPMLWGIYVIGILVSYKKYKKELKSHKGTESFQ